MSIQFVYVIVKFETPCVNSPSLLSRSLVGYSVATGNGEMNKHYNFQIFDHLSNICHHHDQSHSIFSELCSDHASHVIAI